MNQSRDNLRVHGHLNTSSSNDFHPSNTQKPIASPLARNTLEHLSLSHTGRNLSEEGEGQINGREESM